MSYFSKLCHFALQKSSITVTLKTSTLLKVCTCVHMYDINSSIIYLVSPYSFKQDFSSTFHAHNISNWLNFPEILYYVGKKKPSCVCTCTILCQTGRRRFWVTWRQSCRLLPVPKQPLQSGTSSPPRPSGSGAWHTPLSADWDDSVA